MQTTKAEETQKHSEALLAVIKKEVFGWAERFPDKLNELKRKLLEACDGDFNNGLYSSQKNQIEIE